MASKTTIFNKPAPVSNAGVQIAGSDLFADTVTDTGAESIDEIIDRREEERAREERRTEANLRARELQEAELKRQRTIGIVYRETRFLDQLRNQLDGTNIDLPENLGANPNETIGALADFFDEVNSPGSETTGAVELSTSVPRASSTLQSANALSQAVDRQVSLERETAVPNLLAMLRTDLLYPKSEAEFQALVDNMAKLELQRQMAPDFPEAQEQAGQFLGLPIDLAAFRGDVIGFLSLIKEVRLAVARVRETLTEQNGDGSSLATTLLERLNYDASIDLDVYPTSFLVDCLLTDAFGTAVLGNVTSQKFPRLSALDLGLRSTTGALRFDRGLDMDLPSPYPTERGTSFDDFTYADSNALTVNKASLPINLGGRTAFEALYNKIARGGLSASEKIIETQNLVQAIRNGKTKLNLLVKDGDRFKRLSHAEKTSAIIDPLIREIRRSLNQNTTTESNNSALTGVENFESMQNIQEKLLGNYVPLSIDSTNPYNVSNQDSNCVRKSLQTSNGDLVLEESSIIRKDKALHSRSITETVAWKSFLALSGNSQDLLTLQNDAKNCVELLFDPFNNSLGRLIGGAGSGPSIETTIKPCFEAMFEWSQSPPGDDSSWASFAHRERYSTELITSNGFLINGTELLPGGNNFAIGNADNDNLTLEQAQSLNKTKHKLFDLVMQEMFDRAYIIGGGNTSYKEALQLIVRYHVIRSLFFSVYGDRLNASHRKVVEAFIARFTSTGGRISNMGSKVESTLAFDFFFLAAIKDIVDKTIGRDEIEQDIDFQDGISAFDDQPDQVTRVYIDLTRRQESDYKITIDNLEYDLLAPFGTFESFASSLRNNPAVLAAYICLLAPPSRPHEMQSAGLNIADMTMKWVDKFLQINSNCFSVDSETADFTKSSSYSLEYIIDIAARVAAEGILASDILNRGGFNLYRREHNQNLGTLIGPGTKIIWTPLSDALFDDQAQANRVNITAYIEDVGQKLNASISSSLAFNRAVNSITKSLEEIEKSISQIVFEVNNLTNFPYLRALSSTSSNGFARLLLDSMTSGYSTTLALCNTGFSTETNGSEQRAGELPMTILRGGITQRDALAMSSLMSASGLVGTQGEPVKRSRSRTRTLCIGIPNGFMSTAESSDFFVPILSNTGSRLRSQVKSEVYNEIDYRYVELKVRRRDLRFAGDAGSSRYGRNVSTAVSIDWPVDLRIVGARLETDVPVLEDFRGRIQQSYGSHVPGADPYFIQTLIKNFTFTFGKFDLHTGNLLQTFEVGPESTAAAVTPAVRNMITSYGLSVFYSQSIGVNLDETVMVSDKRFFSAAIPTALVPAVKAEASRLHGITENEIESVLERNPSVELGVSRRLVKFANTTNRSSTELNSRHRLDLAYALSAANKLQVADGFLRSISPKAFDQVAYIPIDVATGGFTTLSQRRRSSNFYADEKFRYNVFAPYSYLNRTGGDLFDSVGVGNSDPPQISYRPLGVDKPLNVTLPCEFWVEISEEEL